MTHEGNLADATGRKYTATWQFPTGQRTDGSILLASPCRTMGSKIWPADRI